MTKLSDLAWHRVCGPVWSAYWDEAAKYVGTGVWHQVADTPGRALSDRVCKQLDRCLMATGRVTDG